MNTSATIMMLLSFGTVSFFTVRYFWLALKTPEKPKEMPNTEAPTPSE